MRKKKNVRLNRIKKMAGDTTPVSTSPNTTPPAARGIRQLCPAHRGHRLAVTRTVINLHVVTVVIA